MRPLFIVVICLTLLGCAAAAPQMTLEKDPSVTITLEVMNSPAEHQRGLMYREQLDEDAGMIFVWDQEEPRSFWMKNTLIPLDMLFLNSEGIIVDLHEDVQPCMADPCPSYPSTTPARFVIEVNAGFAEEHQLILGDRLILEHIYS